MPENNKRGQCPICQLSCGKKDRVPILFILVPLIFFLTSCSGTTYIQPQINSLTVAGQYAPAIKLLSENKKAYGDNNLFLYYLDSGYLLHLAGDYKASIEQFEQAKSVYESLYTISLSNQAMTWLLNDNTAPYRGEDFERVFVNMFQALNYACLGDIEEALVEARDVDSKLKAINAQYKPGEKNVYKNDAFVRMLMGFLYESLGTEDSLNDAMISYRKSFESYTENYKRQYGVAVPSLLIENILSLSQKIDPETFFYFKRLYPDRSFMDFDMKKDKAEIYIFHYQGLSPIKLQRDIPLVSPDGSVIKFAFPYYSERVMGSEEENEVKFKALASNGTVYYATSFLGQDIDAIARENLNNRKARVLAKSFIRAGGKYFFVNQKAKSHWMKTIGYLYNIFSEQADLRSWQTLPARIKVARFILYPGTYRLTVGDRILKELEIKKNDKYFMIYRNDQGIQRSATF